MNSWIPVIISLLALVVSAVTAWLTLFRPGELKMTPPTVIFFGPDGSPPEGVRPRLKVFLRTLLFSTARNGQTVESMHVNLQRGESRQNFSIWVYGNERLARGSGLFVGADGIACNHHFLLPEEGAEFRLLAGEYVLRVFAKRVRDKLPRTLSEVRLRISESQSKQLEDSQMGIYFDWGPDQQAYHSHVEKRDRQATPRWFVKALDEGFGTSDLSVFAPIKDRIDE